jgi:hypothetical protein
LVRRWRGRGLSTPRPTPTHRHRRPHPRTQLAKPTQPNGHQLIEIHSKPTTHPVPQNPTLPHQPHQKHLIHPIPRPTHRPGTTGRRLAPSVIFTGRASLYFSFIMDELRFDRIVLIGLGSFQYLLDALVLYRRVDVVIDDDYEFIYIVDQFRPPGLVSFLDEFHETVHIHVLQNSNFHLERGGSNSGADVKAKAYDYDNSYIAYTRALFHGGCLLTHGDHTVNEPCNFASGNFWMGPGTQRTFRRFMPSPFETQPFMEKLVADEEVLSERYSLYRAAKGLPNPGVRVRVEGVGPQEIHGLTVEPSAGPPPGGSSWYNPLVWDALDFVYASSDQYRLSQVPLDAHIVFRDNAAGFIFADYNRLASLVSGRTECEVVKTAMVPELKATRHIFLADALVEVAKARRARLDLPVDASVGDVLAALNRRSWYERLPSRTGRFGLFTGGGILVGSLLGGVGGGGVGSAAGAALGAFDSFILDGFLRGLRPSVFQRYQESLKRVYGTKRSPSG